MKIIVKPEKKKDARGGARTGAGRPSKSKDLITIRGLMEEIRKQTDRDYEELLIEDFTKARYEGDRHLILKYHNLILSKLMNNLNKIEIIDNNDNIKQKEQAFQLALEKLVTLDTKQRGE